MGLSVEKGKEEELKKRLMELVKKGICAGNEVERYLEELKGLTNVLYSYKEKQKLANFYKALADPTRIDMVRIIGTRSLAVCEITAILGISQPTVTHHLKILERAGIIMPRRKGRLTYYELMRKELLKEFERILRS